MSYNALVREKQGGSVLEVASGGQIDILSGGDLNLAGNLNFGDGSDTTLAFLMRVKRLDISADFDNTEQDTGWDLPSSAVVYDVFLNVTTNDASQTIDVGTDGSGSNDPDGFLDGASVNATGLVKGTLASGGQTRGALLRADESGAGVLVPEPDVTSGGESITYTGSDTTNTMRGSIYIVYLDLS